ncbi:helix-turn-helix domain-containing protein [Saccharothrix coeruleofusca]|uniref:Transcriptional regulator n=1 Tax=Saccharothrix coeruleofusca TaxID=33919 RepID=A0A918AP95_9PSEU|nr:helix-turn-helix transcriptional regulator [Saccharothrix coeruleofusca]GGP53316.1 transcriptional regulator [Saccharothrix coeruleofusca]
MVDASGEIGQRVRYWRLRRNLGRKQFADMIGRSTSWLDKVETGERNLARLPVIELVAEALMIDPSALTDAPAAARTAQCVDAVEVSAIRAALGKYPELDRRPVEAISLIQVARQADYLDHAWASSHFTTVAQHLPKLMEAARSAVATVPAVELVDAHRVLVTAYRLASSMLLKFESHHIAWLAADRAMQAAMAVDDTWSLARATRSVARSMTACRQRSEAVEALLNMADRMRPELSKQAGSLLSLYGMLHLAASITAAKQEDAALALDMHHEAERAARSMGEHYATHHTHFGRTNVAIHRVAALVRLGEAKPALRFAEKIPQDAITALPPERRANFLLDLTEANARCGNYREASRSLGQAERAAPQEVRCRPLAHGLLRLLLANTSGEPGRMVRQVAQRAGVPA